MTTKTANFSSLLAPGLRKVWNDEWKNYSAEYDKLCNVVTTEKNYETEYEMTLLGGSFPAKPEGESIQYVDPVGGNTKTFTPASFGMGFRVTQEMMEDDLYAQIKKMPKGLQKAQRNRVELDAIGVLDDASAGGTYTCFDSLAWASTAHTILYTGGTFANRPTSYGALGVTTLTAAITRMEKQVDNDGIKILQKPKLLVIPADLRFIAKELLKSEYKPYTANNEVNPLGGEGLSYFVSHFMSSTTMWALFAEEHGWMWYWRIRPQFGNSDDFDTGDAKFKARHRSTQGVADWRGFDLGNT